MKTSNHILRITSFVIFGLSFWFAGAQETSNSGAHGIDLSALDRSVEPGNDFFRYCNGTWLKRTEIPNDRDGVGVFSTLADLGDKRTSALIEEVVKSNPPTGTGKRKIADLFQSYMDETGIEAKGLAPLKPDLADIAAIHDKKELAHALGESLRADVDPLNNTNFHTANLFGLWTAPDFNAPEHYTAYLLQGGIELPDREYYLGNSERMRKLREQYQAHISAMLKLAGFANSGSRAAKILELERALAEKHWPLSEDQDVHKANNPWKPADFPAKAPGIDWGEFFRGAGLNGRQDFIVWQPSAFVGEAAVVESTPLETWKDWLSYHVIENYAGVLPKAFADERYAFFGTILSGTPQQRPRWQRGVAVVNAVLGDEVGQLYAQEYFPPEAKARAQAMVANIVTAFHKRVEGLDWMTPATKEQALNKLDQLYVGIGYPETWHSYQGLEIKADDIFGNLWRSERFEYHRQVSRLGQPIDRHEWSMTPQTVNAVNLPLQNSLNFPAAILEPPFFDAKAPDALNYGAIGAIIGHEVSHTFDSEGSAFDAKGGLRNWWRPEDLDRFNAVTAKLAAQYDGYKPFPDLSLNGRQTLAENIADLGGLAAAYDGYLAARKDTPVSSQNGFSADQQFFIAFGQAHRSKLRDAALHRQVTTDSHSPSEYRTDTVRNIQAWYSAFQVQPGEKLYLAPNERVRIW